MIVFICFLLVCCHLSTSSIYFHKALQNLTWIKLATNFKEFPALTAIFKDFQGLEFYFEIQRLSRRVRTLFLIDILLALIPYGCKTTGIKIKVNQCEYVLTKFLKEFGECVLLHQQIIPVTSFYLLKTLTKVGYQGISQKHSLYLSLF